MDNELMQQVQQQASWMFDVAAHYVVDSDESYAKAGEFIVGCKALIANIKDHYAESKRKADEAHKSIVAMEKKMLAPLEDAIKIAGNLALEYKQEQDRLCQEEAGEPDGRPTKFISPVPKVAGLSTRKKWKARILSPKAVKREFCTPDLPRINREIDEFTTYNPTPLPAQLAELAERIGGVEIYLDETFSGRTNELSRNNIQGFSCRHEESKPRR